MRRCIDEIVRPELKKRTTADLLAAFGERDILAGRVNDFPDIIDDGHVQAVEAVTWLSHKGIGDIPMPIIPGAPAAEGPRAEAPHLGEHTTEILTGLGYDAAHIRTMTETGAALAR